MRGSIVGFILPGMIALLLVLVCTVPAMSRSIWLDEGIAVNWARMRLDRIPNAIRRYEAHPPGYHLVLGAWIRIGGVSEAWLRAVSLIAHLLTLVVIGRIVFDLSASTRAAWLAVLLAAPLPPLCWAATEVRPYTLVNLICAVTWFVLIRAMDRGGRWRWVLMGFCLAGMAYTWYLTVFALPALWVFLLVRARPDRRRLIGMLGACLVAALLLAPWARVLPDQWRFGKATMSAVVPPQAPENLGRHLLLESVPWAGLGIVGLAIALVLFGYVWVGRSRFEGPSNRNLLAAFAYPLTYATGLFLVFQAAGGGFNPRYLVYCAAAWTVPFALALDRIDRRIAWALCIAFGLLNGFASFEQSQAPPRGDWKVAVPFVEEHLRPEDRLVVVKGFADVCYRFYAKAPREDRIRLPEDLPARRNGEYPPTFEARHKEGMTGLLATDGRVWLLVSYCDAKTREWIGEVMERAGYRRRLVQKYGRLTVEMHEPVTGP